MKKVIFTLLLIINYLYADVKQDMFSLYQNQRYEDACNLGFEYFKENKKNEDFLSIYAFSCLKSDYIDRLALPLSMMKFTPESRANSAYLSVILMQKKLLYHALVDNYDLSSFDLPATNYVLSIVFNLYSKLKNNQKRTFYLFNDPKNSKISYKLYLMQNYKIPKMVIEEYCDNKLVKKHTYW